MKAFRGRSLRYLGLLVAVLLALGGWAIQVRLQPDRLKQDAISWLRRFFPGDRVIVDVGSTVFSFTDGFHIRDVSIRVTSPRPTEIIHVDHVLVDVDHVSLDARAVNLRGLVLHLVRRGERGWYHDALIESMVRPEGGPGAFPTIHVSDSRVIVRDESDAPIGPVELHITDIGATLTTAPATGTRNATPAGDFSIEGRLGSRGTWSTSGSWNPESARIRFERLVANVDLDGKSQELPPWLSSWLRRWQVRGKLELLGSLSLGRNGMPENVNIAATIVGGGAVLPDGGFGLDSISAVLNLRDDRFTLERMRGLTTAGSCRASGALGFRVGPEGEIEVTSTDLSVDFPRIVIDDKLLERLPASVTEPFAGLRILGALALRGSLSGKRFPPPLESVKVEIEPLDLSLYHDRFPVPISILQGKIALSGGSVVINPSLGGTVDTGRLSVGGTLQLEQRDSQPAPPSGESATAPIAGVTVREGALDIRIDGITASTVIHDALPEKGRQVWESLDPAGKADVKIRAAWNPSRQSPHVVVTVRPTDMKIQYSHFPLAMDRIREGALVIDFTKMTASLINLAGRHRHRVIRGSGTIQLPRDDRGLDLTFSSEAIALDRELLAAIPEGPRQLLVDNRISGKARVVARVTRKSDQQHASTVVTVHVQDMVIHPPGFPFPLRLVGGRATVRGDTIDLHGLEGGESLRFTVDGRIAGPSGENTVDLEGEVTNLVTDSRLLTLFAQKARRRVRAMHLHGAHDFNFTTKFRLGTTPGTARKFEYEITNLRSRDVGMDVGIRLNHIALEGSLRGGGVFGQRHEIEGRVQMTTATFNRLQFHDTTVHFVYGKLHPAVTAARAGKAMEGFAHVVDRSFVDRLGPALARHSFQILVDPARLHGGTVQGFFFADVDEPGEMRGHFKARDVNIARVAGGAEEVVSIETTGTGTGSVRFSGRTGHADTLTGEGKIEITGQSLGTVPVISSAVETITRKEGVLKFSDLLTDFSIHDGKFHTDEGGMLVKGPAMSLRGHGTMDFHGVLNLSLVPQVLGNFKLPLLDVVKKNLAEVVVTGPLEKPSARLKVLKVPVRLK